MTVAQDIDPAPQQHIVLDDVSWRYDGRRLHVLVLSTENHYQEANSSPAFPFLPIHEFEKFLERLRTESDTNVVRDFHQWVRTLKR